jgi:D-alanyl-lipoteichoic acid acyltransferase DltB (MBOAT superfamily)
VYIPLGGNRRGALRRRINVFIVFLLSGLWHGANWTFVLWGGLHGLLVTVFGGNSEKSNKGLIVIKAIITFISVTILWVFFRASDITQAIDYLLGLLQLQSGSSAMGMNITELLLSVCLVIIMMLVEYRRKNYLIESNKAFYWYVAGMVTLCYWLGVFGENQFIYFQF